MSYIILLLSILISSHQVTYDDDLEKYKKAYEYISQDSVYVQSCFDKYFKNPIKNICVSQEIIIYEFGPFKDDIIQYYQEIYGINSDSSSLLFQKVINNHSEEEIKFNNYFDKTPCDLIIFFSSSI